MSEENQVFTSTLEANDQFEPTVWIENLVSILARFLADPRLRYSQGVQPNVVDGEVCLVVAAWLESTDRATYDHVMAFAQSNQLKTKLDRRSGERAMQKPA
jgi:secreted protein with Ig-like and vWFA domain